MRYYPVQKGPLFPQSHTYIPGASGPEFESERDCDVKNNIVSATSRSRYSALQNSGPK